MRRKRSQRGSTPYEAMVFAGFKVDGECLSSLATPHSGGYRYIQQNRKTYFSHRLAFEAWHGAIPNGMQVDHTCHNEAAERGECSGGACTHRSCVNPAHLRAVSQAANLQASPLFREAISWRKNITHCPRNHEYTTENTRWYRGSRQCRACAREKMRERRAAE